MKASKAIIKCLEKENVDILFGYPGGAVLPLYEALRESDIKHVLVRNEQSLVHYASGYAREKNRTGVCIATSGPGATNTITGIATAYLDSIPIVIITGQVNTELIGTDAFQEADIKGATEPFTKHNYLVKNAEDIPRIIKEAFFIANSGRKGPVLVDIPRNVQEAEITFKYPEKVDILGYKPTFKGHAGQIKRIINKIKASKKPVIYAGGGIILADARTELREFAEMTGIPVINSLMGIGGMSQESTLYAGIVGSHGYQYSNEIIARTDLLITIGARMSNRAAAGFSKLNPNIEFIHIDIDPAEIGKNVEFTLPIVGDAKLILQALIEKDLHMDFSQWLEEIEEIRNIYPVSLEMQPGCIKMNPKEIINELSLEMKDDSCLVADVGQNQIWSALYFKVFGERKFITSGGLGTMAYSLPAAAGMKMANPERQVVNVMGDGSFQMCLGELAVVRENNIGIKIILINNTKLGMVRGLQHDCYGKDNYFGVDLEFQVNFVKLAEAYSIKGYEVEDMESFRKVLHEVLENDEPCLIQCNVDPNFRTF
ncbi:MAG: biosynthetic-type acetolactate synthase large subunit [Eubacteriaceae bacterium]|nr:biosynthetic-type acetolactate synthase large subunit [Eubacteriaceae bacterium]